MLGIVPGALSGGVAAWAALNDEGSNDEGSNEQTVKLKGRLTLQRCRSCHNGANKFVGCFPAGRRRSRRSVRDTAIRIGESGTSPVPDYPERLWG